MGICNIIPNFNPLSPKEESLQFFSIHNLNNSLSNKKISATGMEDVSYAMLKNMPNNAKKVLLKCYNNILQGHDFPYTWKKYIIVFILKPNKSPDSPNSYRPIVLSSCFLNTLEIMFKNKIEWMLESKNVFSPFQTGFRKGMGIQNNISFLCSYVDLTFKDNQMAIAVFLDLKSAYDYVDPYALYEDLNNLTIPTEINNVILKIMQDRHLFTRKNDGSFFGSLKTSAGLPHGSPLSAILFNIYIRNLFNIKLTNVLLIGYADDLVLIAKGTNMATMVRDINSALERILDLTPPNVTIKNTTIPYKNEVKYLGVILDKHLKWKIHIENTSNRATRDLNVLRSEKSLDDRITVWWGANPLTLLTVIHALVKSHLEFASFVLAIPLKLSLKKLDVIHHQGLRICLGCMKSTPINTLLCEATDFPLSLRRNILAIQFLSKILPLTNHPLLGLLKTLRIKYLVTPLPEILGYQYWCGA
ncbi:hypothetical protein HUJ04_007112 [Dendroctonus ponderosae]|nr:hypothetical protein HUJ04_007112 [Dendroctonus ponderosae]